MKLNIKANEDVTVFDKLEFVIYGNKEKFILSGKALGVELEDNKTYGFASIILNLLNMEDNDFQDLENHIGILNSVITPNPYNIERAVLQKTKIYIDDINSNDFIKKDDIFRISCELGYFKMVDPCVRHDFKSIDSKKLNGIKKYSSDNLNYIYKCCKENKIKTLTTYKIEDFEDFIVASLSEIFGRNKTIKKCKNCGKYFIPKKSDASYCDSLSPQDVSKTCKDFARTNNHNIRLKKDEIYNSYRIISKSFSNKIRYYKERNDKILCQQHEETYNKFKKEYSEKEEQFKNKSITKKEFLEWLKKFEPKQK